MLDDFVAGGVGAQFVGQHDVEVVELGARELALHVERVTAHEAE